MESSESRDLVWGRAWALVSIRLLAGVPSFDSSGWHRSKLAGMDVVGLEIPLLRCAAIGKWLVCVLFNYRVPSEVIGVEGSGVGSRTDV
ncbi:MAG: hypothetical protein V3T49_05230, partial [Dehalococcoidia bacterium]